MPPGIEMVTPNGRFEINKRICMSMSDYHPESWNTTWNVQTIIIGLVSFMCTSERITGCSLTTDAQKKLFAKNSLDHNLKNAKFNELFKN
jgi:ubiquitin-conjugating enzyme E2 J2